MRFVQSLCLPFCFQTATAFTQRPGLNSHFKRSLSRHSQHPVEKNFDGTDGTNNRRDFVKRVVVTSLPFLVPTSSSASEEQPPSQSSAPIVVIGANGRTGSQCIGACVDRKIPVRATTRSGEYTASPGAGSPLVQPRPCDVTSPDTIGPVVKGARAVIFAASASKQGGPPSSVDNAGLVAVAKACLDANVPRLIIVSSGAVTKPASPVYLFLNAFGKIMEEKIRGEDSVRELFAASSKKKDGTMSPSYTIIRPGGLTEELAIGASALELNQGDSKSGRISRADVAQLCVESIGLSSTFDTTFECYNKDTGAALASVGISNIFKAKTDEKAFLSGRECQGGTWEDIFSGLEKDA